MNKTVAHHHISGHELGKILDSIGWGLFLILIGVLWLMPEGVVPEGSFLFGAGVILLGLNAARYLAEQQISGFWSAVGIIILTAGIGEYYGLDLPIFPIVIIMCGISLLIKPLIRKKDM